MYLLSLIKVQNAIINQIQFHTFGGGGGLIIDVFFCLQADGHITGVGVGVVVGRAYKWQFKVFVAYKWQFKVFALRLPIVHKNFFTVIQLSL